MALEALGQADDFTQEILLYTYHPTRKYYIKKLPWAGEGINTLWDSQDHWMRLLDRSASRLLSGQTQKQAFAVFIRSLTPIDAEIFKKMVKKDLRVGLAAKSINAVFNELIPVFGFMKAKVYDENRLIKGSFVSLKIDCIRAMLRDRTLYSSGGNVITGVQHIARQFEPEDEFDGELTIPGKIFQVASGLLRSNADNPTAVFNVFDSPSWKVPFNERYNAMEQAAKHWPENIVLLKHIIAKGSEHVKHQFAVALDHGYEGLVVKSPGHLYQLKRSWDWMKIKAADPDEVTIIGFNEGTGKFEGNLGSVKCRRKNGVIVDVGGFTDEIRYHIWNNKELWLNEIIEILYHEETPDGSLRHPRFNYTNDAKIHRHRWDKSGRPLKSWPKSVRIP